MTLTHEQARERLVKLAQDGAPFGAFDSGQMRTVIDCTPSEFSELVKALPSPAQQTVTREEIASVIYNSIFGGTSDPILDENAQGLAYSLADEILSLLRSRGINVGAKP